MVDSITLEGHKLKWHIDRVSDWLKGRRIAPIYTDMGITQTCNIACKYCIYAVPEKRNPKTIPTDSLIRFLKDAAEIGMKAVGFLGDGEPMIHPGVYDATIAGAEAGLDMAVATNGLIMKASRIKDFLSALTWIRFHISAANPETYASIMGTKQDNYKVLMRNLEACVGIKEKYNLNVTIGLQMILIPECTREIVPLAKLGRDLGVDYTVIKQCSQITGIEQKSIIEDYTMLEPLFREAESYSNDNYSVIIKRTKMTSQNEKKYNQCFGCEFLPQISGNGDVYNCANFFGDNRFLVGNIVEQSFKDIVSSDRYLEVMKKVKNEIDVHRQCAIGCRQNEINEYLWTLINPPEHVNFI